MCGMTLNQAVHAWKPCVKAELSSAKESRLKFFHRSRQITGYCKNLIVVHIVPVIFL